jgi:hypothetical protein
MERGGLHQPAEDGHPRRATPRTMMTAAEEDQRRQREKMAAYEKCSEEHAALEASSFTLHHSLLVDSRTSSDS